MRLSTNPRRIEPQTLGFKYVTLDLDGFRSGSMNAGLPLVEITLPQLPMNS